jgi:hypothetical protein
MREVTRHSSHHVIRSAQCRTIRTENTEQRMMRHHNHEHLCRTRWPSTLHKTSKITLPKFHKIRIAQILTAFTPASDCTLAFTWPVLLRRACARGFGEPVACTTVAMQTKATAHAKVQRATATTSRREKYIPNKFSCANPSAVAVLDFPCSQKTCECWECKDCEGSRRVNWTRLLFVNYRTGRYAYIQQLYTGTGSRVRTDVVANAGPGVQELVHWYSTILLLKGLLDSYYTVAQKGSNGLAIHIVRKITTSVLNKYRVWGTSFFVLLL